MVITSVGNRRSSDVALDSLYIRAATSFLLA